MWADESGASFTMEKAKIEGRDISYPYLLDEKGDPRLESTNDFLVWYCEHAKCRRRQLLTLGAAWTSQ